MYGKHKPPTGISLQWVSAGVLMTAIPLFLMVGCITPIDYSDPKNCKDPAYCEAAIRRAALSTLVSRPKGKYIQC